GAGAAVVGWWGCRIAVLEREEVAGLLRRQSLCQADGAVRAFRSGRVDDLRAVEAQQSAALLGHVVGHHAGQRVALELCDERERDPRVSARRLEQFAGGLELAPLLGVLDHCQRDSILDRAGRVLALQLREEAHGGLWGDTREVAARGGG